MRNGLSKSISCVVIVIFIIFTVPSIGASDASTGGNQSVSPQNGTTYAPSTGEGWLEGYSFRQCHVIQYTYSEYDCSNYQMRFVVDYDSPATVPYMGNTLYVSGDCQPDFHDVRFTAADGVTEYSYWMESFVVYDHAIFWVKIVEDLSLGSINMYAYYGNPAADCGSDGASTFVFFEDFSEPIAADDSDWDITTYGAQGEPEPPLKDELHVRVLSPVAVLTGFKFDSQTPISQSYFHMQVRGRWANLDYLRGGGLFQSALLVDLEEQVTGLSLNLYGDYTVDCYKYVEGSGSSYSHLVDYSSGDAVFDYYVDGTQLDLRLSGRYSKTWQGVVSGFHYPFTLELWAALQYWTDTVSVDSYYTHAFVCKWVPEEPTHTAWNGEEEFSDPIDDVRSDLLYRKQHTIIGAIGAGSDYQIQFILHHGTGSDSGPDVYLGQKCRPDFNDIRFTSSDEVTKLDYWIEEKVDGQYAKVWVEVKESLDTDRVVFLYYGNPRATSESNGDATFIFFEDGERGDLSRWTAAGSSWSSSATRVKNGAKSVYYNGATSGLDLRKDLSISGSFLIHAWHQAINGLKGTYQRAYWGTSNHHCSVHLRQYDSDWTYNHGGGASYVEWTGDSRDNAPVNTWLETDLAFDRATGQKQLWNNGVDCGTKPNLDWTNNQIEAGDALNRLLFSGQYGYNSWFDDLYIRKWMQDGPTHGRWGDRCFSNGRVDMSDWDYCKPHVIKQTDGAGTGYQVYFAVFAGAPVIGGYDGNPDPFCVYLYGKALPDFGDVRFVDSSGRSLPYCIIETVPGYLAHVWVKVLDNLDEGDSTVYIHYGNPYAVSQSDGAATFLFFDDFEGVTYDGEKWYHCGDPDCEVSDGVLTQPNDDAYQQGLATRSTWTSGVSVEALVLISEPISGHGNMAGIWIDDETPSEDSGFAVGQSNCVSIRCDWSYDPVVDTFHLDVLQQYQLPAIYSALTLRIDWIGTEAKYYYGYRHDGTYQSILTRTGSDAFPGADHRFYLLGTDPDEQQYAWVFVRKVTDSDSESIHGAWSAGATPVGPATFKPDMCIDNRDFEEWSEDIPEPWSIVQGEAECSLDGWGDSDDDPVPEAIRLYNADLCRIQQDAVDSGGNNDRVDPIRGRTVDFSFKFAGEDYTSCDWGRATIVCDSETPSEQTFQGEWVMTVEPEPGSEFTWATATVTASIPEDVVTVRYRIEVARFDGNNVNIKVDDAELVVIMGCYSICDTPAWLNPVAFGNAQLIVSLASFQDIYATIGVTLKANSYSSEGWWVQGMVISLESVTDAHLQSLLEVNDEAKVVCSDPDWYNNDAKRMKAYSAFMTGFRWGMGGTMMAGGLLLTAAATAEIINPLTWPWTIGLFVLQQGIGYALGAAGDESQNTVTAVYGALNDEPWLDDPSVTTVWSVPDGVCHYFRIHAAITWGNIQTSYYNGVPIGDYISSYATTTLDVFVALA